MKPSASQYLPAVNLTSGTRTTGTMFAVLNAAPTGSAGSNDVVANFDGATVTRRRSQADDPASLADNMPINHIASTTLGSEFQILRRGTWLVKATVVAQTAATVVAGLGVDNGAGELNADPVANGDTIPDAKRWIGAAAGDQGSLELSAIVKVTEGRRASVRLLLSDGAGAGAAAASLLLASCNIQFILLGDV